MSMPAIQNGRVTTDWIDNAVANTRATGLKVERLAAEIRQIRTNTWSLRPGNLVNKLRVFAAWFSGQSAERREEIAAEYTTAAIALENHITELMNSASTTAATLGGLKSQIDKVIAMFTRVRPILNKAHDDASASLHASFTAGVGALAQPNV